ncbi:MAG: Ger(x)C family spore germination protein [Clostridiaceae bacterium]|nr:Ger(x)C family spore germination protein [Clostridiaceae bacterium]
MKQRKNFLFLISVCLVMFLCTGCWNYREIEKCTIIAGIAIDEGTDGYKYHITYEVLNFSTGNDQTIKSSIIESDGNSIFDSLRKAVTMSDEKLYVGNCEIIILSKAIAEDGIEQLADFFVRDAEPRITAAFAVSDEETAAKILNIHLKTNEPVSYKILGILDQSQKVLGHILSVPLFEIVGTLNSESSKALTLPKIRLVEISDNSEPQLYTNAILRQGKMVGSLKEDENLYFLMLKNKIESGILLTQVPDPLKTVSLEIFNCKTTIKPIINGDNVTMEIKVKLNTALGEDNGQEKYKNKSGELKKIEEAASKTVEAGLMNLISDMQNNYNADIFGFGEMIEKEKYEDWEKMSGNWDNIFPNVKCKISADIRIINSATAVPKGGD